MCTRLGKAGKRTSLRQNQMEGLHEGPIFHIGTNGEEVEEEEKKICNEDKVTLTIRH
jgi:hypothetical protein